MSQSSIVIRGAREHNLADIDLEIPRDKLVVITGISGSGKSSLAFDTIYAEGQRRYVESLSSYARMFLGQMSKPDIDSIDGLSPAVSIDQKSTSRNPRSTVGTITEIYDYLRLLFARVGKAHCPECGREISEQSAEQIAKKIIMLKPGARAMILAPIVSGKKGEYAGLFEKLLREGFTRIRLDGELMRLDDDIAPLNKNIKHFIEVVVDRLVLKEESASRINAAVETAVNLASGKVMAVLLESDEQSLKGNKTSSGATGGLKENEFLYSTAFACPEHGHSLDTLQPRDFSFNAPYGACPKCLGIGFTEEVDVSLLVPDPSKSLEEGALAPFKSGNYYPQVLRAVCNYMKDDSRLAWQDLKASTRKALLYGLGKQQIRVDYVTVTGRHTHWYIRWEGAVSAVKARYREAKSDKQRDKLGSYFTDVACLSCQGKRLKPEILAVTINGKSIADVCDMSIAQASAFFEGLEFDGFQKQIAAPIVKEIGARLRFLINVGLDYLNLSRAASTLSGGEAQRIRLATQIGSGLMGVLYILDEPSIGLHQRDNARLIDTLLRLRDLGNTVVVVEHDEDTIRRADFVVDMGPGAGEAGGRVLAAGPPEEIMHTENSLTADYLSGRRKIPVPSFRRIPLKGHLILEGARENNLRNITLKIPLGTFCVITGVSGSGKSSLIANTLAPALANRLNRAHLRVGPYEKLSGTELLDKVVNIDQSPIGRTPRSNPATYIGLWDEIRALFASTVESKAKGYGPGRFSFNVAGGRCETCKGDGQIKVEMHFLPDVYVPCEQCGGKRYNQETLQVHYRGKNIADVLEMTVSAALEFFENIPSVRRRLQTLYDVGLGYIRLGQSATTLSGGEAQRVKLSKELQRVQTGNTIYILDEPTTGLHFEDIAQLLNVLQRLVDSGNTVVVIEHNLDVIKCADHVVDLGPEGGERGGRIIAEGTPEEIACARQSYTGAFLAKKLLD